SECWSKRAEARIVGSRQAMPWIEPSRTTILTRINNVEWWTFAGCRANDALAQYLRETSGLPVLADNLTVTVQAAVGPADVDRWFSGLHKTLARNILSPISDDAVEDIKFAACVPQAL